MNYSNNNVIFQRFNSAAYDLALAKLALRKEDKESFIKHLRDAGEAISQTLEFSLKNHLDRYISTQERKFFKIDKENIPSLIEKYIDESGNDYKYNTLDDTCEPDVDFVFLKKNKYSLTNAAKHTGIEPNYEIQKKYLEEIRKFIHQYIDNQVILKTIEEYDKVDLSTWDLLYTACDRFSPDNRNYILIIGKNQKSNQQYIKNLSIPSWNMIIDFDYNSNETGFFHSAYSTNNIQPHKIKASDLVDTNTFSRYNQSHYHYFANSYNGSGDTEPDDFQDWNRRYGKKTEIFLKSYAEVLSNQKNIVVVLYDSRRHINFLCERIDQYFGNNVSYIFANDLNDNLSQICEDFKGVKVNISTINIADGLANISSNFGKANPHIGQILIPFMEKSQTETSGILTESEYAQLEEYFEVVHKGLPDINKKEDEYDKRSFLVGENKISWSGLKSRFDVENFKSNKRIIKAVEKVIENGRGKIQLIHDAGFGGTTIARRIAWEIHNDYPTLILKKYRDSKVKESLIRLHEKTRKTILVIMEVPQSITLDEVDSLFKSIPQARPIVFLIVKRGKPNSNDLVVSDWGNDCIDLVNAYKPYLNEYTNEDVRLKKTKELDEIIYSCEAYKKTPFYIGLLTFEEKFYALKDYINKFVVEILEKEEQKKVLIYLALCNDYLGQGLPSSFFRPLFKVSSTDIIELENYFFRDSTIVESLLTSYLEGNHKFWTIKHNFLAKELKKQILSGSSDNPEIWKQGLADICVKFIHDSSSENNISEYIQEVLKKLFIGNRKDRAGEDFTPIINDIGSVDGKELVFVTLKETYPDNPHYCSHLARFYAYHNKNREKALKYADEAIRLSEIDGSKDPLLYHIKGMCLRSIAYDEIEKHRNQKLNGETISVEYVNNVIYQLVPEAAMQFELSREIAKKQNRIDEYGFIAHIQLLIAAIDYAIYISGKGKADFFDQNEEPFSEWLDLSESLLEEVKRINLDDDESGKIEDCVNDIMAFYDNYEQILQNLRNQLDKGKNPARTRRQIVRTYFRKKTDLANNMKIVNSILSLMEQNIDNEPDNERNFYLWFQAARYSKVSLDDAISKLSKWKANSNAVDSIFYFYILKVFRALEGYTDATIDAFNLIKECKSKGKSLITIFEWYGKGKGLSKLVNRNEITPENKNETLELVEGYFTDYLHDGSGKITIANKLEVFFSPTQAKLTSDDLNQAVEFYLGFSFDGLRADSYSVRIKGNEPRNKEPYIEVHSTIKHNKTNEIKPLVPLYKLDLSVNKTKIDSKRKKGKVIDLLGKPNIVMGYIEDSIGKRIFFHKNNERKEVFDKLKIGSEVYFELKMTAKGRLALKLEIIED